MSPSRRPFASSTVNETDASNPWPGPRYTRSSSHGSRMRGVIIYRGMHRAPVQAAWQDLLLVLVKVAEIQDVGTQALLKPSQQGWNILILPILHTVQSLSALATRSQPLHPPTPHYLKSLWLCEAQSQGLNIDILPVVHIFTKPANQLHCSTW